MAWYLGDDLLAWQLPRTDGLGWPAPRARFYIYWKRTEKHICCVCPTCFFSLVFLFNIPYIQVHCSGKPYMGLGFPQNDYDL